MPCDKMCLIKAFIYQTIYIKDEKKSRQALEFFFQQRKRSSFWDAPICPAGSHTRCPQPG